MTRVIWAFALGGMLLATVAVLGCGGAQPVAKTDPAALLAAGRYADARSAAKSGTGDELRDTAVVSLSLLAEEGGEAASPRAVDALLAGGNAVAAAASADEMLGLVSSLPAPRHDEISLLATETALGAAGKGPLARSQSGPAPGSEVSRSLAAAVLERLHRWLASTERVPDSTRLLQVWNGSYTLLGGSMATGDDEHLAWTLYAAMGGLSVYLDDTARDSDLTKVLLRSTVEVVEQNPAIATAVRCDLASPFDGLRAALTYDRELLGRFERAVASAVGCNRGKYAPLEEQ
jgi:hypothetical protein